MTIDHMNDKNKLYNIYNNILIWLILSFKFQCFKQGKEATICKIVSHNCLIVWINFKG
jgi:hypothetical protein